MLSIPHEMSFVPNLLRIYFNHVKNNIEIHSGMNFEEYSFIKEEMCDEGYEEKTVPVRLDVSLQCAAGYRARIVPVNLETQEK